MCDSIATGKGKTSAAIKRLRQRSKLPSGDTIVSRGCDMCRTPILCWNDDPILLYGNLARERAAEEGCIVAYTGAARKEWKKRFGDIPPDMVVCHTCDETRCINPDHLFLGTSQDNNRDKMTKGRHRTRLWMPPCRVLCTYCKQAERAYNAAIFGKHRGAKYDKPEG